MEKSPHQKSVAYPVTRPSKRIKPVMNIFFPFSADFFPFSFEGLHCQDNVILSGLKCSELEPNFLAL